jgi:hypothetical protein
VAAHSGCHAYHSRVSTDFVGSWPEGEVLARPLFGRFRGQSGRARNNWETTLMTPKRKCACLDPMLLVRLDTGVPYDRPSLSLV